MAPAFASAGNPKASRRHAGGSATAGSTGPRSLRVRARRGGGHEPGGWRGVIAGPRHRAAPDKRSARRPSASAQLSAAAVVSCPATRRVMSSSRSSRSESSVREGRNESEAVRTALVEAGRRRRRRSGCCAWRGNTAYMSGRITHSSDLAQGSYRRTQPLGCAGRRRRSRRASGPRQHDPGEPRQRGSCEARSSPAEGSRA
jgi:hypothetical protein